MSKLGVWVAMLVYFGAVWLYPGYVIYETYAEQIEAHTGGAMLYTIGGLFGLILFNKIRSKVANMDSTGTKVLLAYLISMLLLYLGRGGSNFILVNFADIDHILLHAMFGQSVAMVAGFVALKIDKTYVKEIGLL